MMNNLYDTIMETKLEYISDDYRKFMKDYKKFVEYIDKFKDEWSDVFKHAVDQISEWVDSLKDGLPFSYHRYEQFTYAIATYDPSMRDGLGGLYDKDVTNTIIKYWEKSTGYKIHNIYKS